MDEIYNGRMEHIDSPDLKLGWLEETERSVAHEAVPAAWAARRAARAARRAAPSATARETAASYASATALMMCYQ